MIMEDSMKEMEKILNDLVGIWEVIGRNPEGASRELR